MTTFLNTLGRIVLTGMQVAAQQNTASRAKSEEDQYWDRRLNLALDTVEQLRQMPIRQFGGSMHPDQRRIDRETQERNLKCNELSNAARRAHLEKSKWNMDRVESDIKTAVFFAS